MDAGLEISQNASVPFSLCSTCKRINSVFVYFKSVYNDQVRFDDTCSIDVPLISFDVHLYNILSYTIFSNLNEHVHNKHGTVKAFYKNIFLSPKCPTETVQ